MARNDLLLTVNLGNTSTVLGVFRRGDLIARWPLSTITHPQEGDYLVLIRSLFDAERVPLPKQAIISSVVPPATRGVSAALERCGMSCTLVTSHTDLGLRLGVENPQEVGTDRLVNASAVHAEGLAQDYAVIVDLGSATTFDVLNRDGVFLGGSIAPGPVTAAEALYYHTAQLPRIDLTPPPSVLGRNTVHAMQSGLVLGHAAMIDGLLHRYRQELEGTVLCIATGGYASTFSPLCTTIDQVDLDLTLRGLWHIAQRTQEKSFGRRRRQ